MTTDTHLQGTQRAIRHGFWKRTLLHGLQSLRHGSLSLTDAEGTVTFGQPVVAGDGSPIAHVIVNTPAFYRRVALGGTVGAGEAYMDGDWDCDDLVALFEDTPGYIMTFGCGFEMTTDAKVRAYLDSVR